MDRSPLSLVATAAALGGACGVLEVAWRASPRLGMDLGEVAQWVGWAVVLGAALCAAAAGLGLAVRRPLGLAVAALVAGHVGLWWRTGPALNAFVREPRVWGVLLVVGVVAVGLGLLVDGTLRRNVRAVLVAAVLAALAGLPVAVARTAVPDRALATASAGPSVLVVTVDTQRADRLAPYGADNPTPAWSRLASEGVLYTQAVSTAPITEPSHLAILTGIAPHSSGVVTNGTAIGDRPALLSHALAREGFATAGFVTGFPLKSVYGWDQGMDVYDDDFGRVPGMHALMLVQWWDQVVLPAHTLRERRGDHATDRAIRWLSRHADDRFFLWVHLFDPHGPYEAPDHPFDPPTGGDPLPLPAYWPPPHRAVTSTDWLTAAYDAEVRFADAQLGRLLSALDALGRADDTVVVATADHGESLVEHGVLFDHGDDLYDPSLLVPLVVRAPGGAAGVRLDCQVSTLDVTPTVLGLVGVADGLAREGRDRAAEVRQGGCAPVPVVASTVGGRFVAAPPVDHALRVEGAKVIRDGANRHDVCFDLVADPGELAPLGSCAALGQALDAALVGAVRAAAPRDDAATRMALEALGYVDDAGHGE